MGGKFDFLCMVQEPNHIHHITGRSREIQAAIVLGGMINPNIKIKLTAFNALLSSLKVLERHFIGKADCKCIMDIVCEAAESNENQVRVIALQNLVKIMKRYYQHMERYMVKILPISISAIESNCDEVALQGIEFWSSVCDKEIGLANEAAECCESKFYAKDALKDLIPVLINFLNRQGGLDDKDDWNPHKAAGVCLMLLVECCQDDVYRHVLRVFRQNIEDYRSRDAAFMALGFFLEGPHQNAVRPYFEQALFFLIWFARKNVIVTDSLAWTLCRICELLPHVALATTSLLVDILLEGIDGEPCVAVNVCMVLRSLMVAFDNTVQHEEEGALISDWEIWFSVSRKLSVVNSRLGSNQEDLKSAVDETLRICQRVLKKNALEMLDKLACENVIVTYSLAWTLCRFCELLPHVALANTKPLVKILSKGVDEEPCVALNVFPVLMSLMGAFDTTVQHEEERPLIDNWTAWLQLSKQLFDLNRILDPKRKYLKDDVEEASRSSRRLLEIHVMPMLVRLMKDESVIVTHPLAWTLCRICELLPHVALANTEPLVNILSEGLDKEPRAAVKVCSVLRLLMVTFIENHAAHEEEAPLIGHEAMWLSVSEKLDDLIRRLDANQEDLKSAVEEASSTCQRVLEMYIPAAEL